MNKKLTWTQKFEIADLLLKEGLSVEEIGEKFNITPQRVVRVAVVMDRQAKALASRQQSKVTKAKNSPPTRKQLRRKFREEQRREAQARQRAEAEDKEWARLTREFAEREFAEREFAERALAQFKLKIAEKRERLSSFERKVSIGWETRLAVIRAEKVAKDLHHDPMRDELRDRKPRVLDWVRPGFRVRAGGGSRSWFSQLSDDCEPMRPNEDGDQLRLGDRSI